MRSHPSRKQLAALVFIAMVALGSLGTEGAVRRPPLQRTGAADATVASDVIVRALELGVPGVSIAISTGNRTLIVESGGVTSFESNDSIHPGTIFQIASVTKQFTAAIIMRMFERGEIELDEDVRSWIPELETGDRTITIRHLLNHTSGLPNYVEDEVDPYQPTTHATRITQLSAKPFRFRPGRMWEYNNSGYYLLGIVIERATGDEYAEVLRREITDPAALERTSYCGLEPASPVPEGHVVTADGAIPVPPLHPSIPFAGGAICSTASDLMRWSILLERGAVVSPESYEEMIAPTPITFGRPVGYGFGLAFGMIGEYEMIYHDGAIPGFSSFLATVPELDLRIAVLANVQSFEIYLAREIALEILRGLDAQG